MATDSGFCKSPETQVCTPIHFSLCPLEQTHMLPLTWPATPPLSTGNLVVLTGTLSFPRHTTLLHQMFATLLGEQCPLLLIFPGSSF